MLASNAKIEHIENTDNEVQKLTEAGRLKMQQIGLDGLLNYDANCPKGSDDGHLR